MLALDKGNFHAPGENRTRHPASFCQQVDDWTPPRHPASFCQQVDDWTLLKITKKIIQRNVCFFVLVFVFLFFSTKEKETRVKR